LGHSPTFTFAVQTFFAGQEMTDRKLKKVAGHLLTAESFAYVGDEQNPETWKLSVFVPGDASLTRNFVKNAAHRFADTKGIPESERAAVWQLIVGAAKCLGLNVQKQAPAMAKRESEKPAPFVVDAEDAELKESLALAALHRDKFLHSIGYGET